MKKILILGGGGYVGTRLNLDLRKTFDITNVDINWFHKPPYPSIKKDFNQLTQDFIQSFDVIILLAGHSSVKMSEGDIRSAYNNNVNNFINLISKITPKQKFIYASSASVYGNTKGNIVNETYDKFQVNNQYDISKYTIDLYASKSGLDFYGLRFGTVNGYSPIMRTDVMINAMLNNGLSKGKISLFSGGINRSILGITDLSRAIQAIISSPPPNPGIYNLASFYATAKEIAYKVGDISSIPVEEIEANSLSQAYDFIMDVSKFETNFNFTFTDTIESLTLGILDNYSTAIKTNRNEPKQYY